jgi:hypothetical protein
MYKHRTHVFMSALGAALSAGAAAVATAFDQAEKFAVTGALKVTHIITEQVCDFDTLDQLEAYLNAVADRHHWFRHDQAAPGAALDASSQVDTTASQYDALAAAPADVASTVHVNLALDQLATGAAPADAITATVVTPDAPIAAPAEPVAPVEPTEPAAPAADQATPATEQPAADPAAQ